MFRLSDQGKIFWRKRRAFEFFGTKGSEKSRKIREILERVHREVTGALQRYSHTCSTCKVFFNGRDA